MKKNGKWFVEQNWSVLKESEKDRTLKTAFYQQALLTAFCIWRKKYSCRHLLLTDDNGHFDPEFARLKSDNERIKQRLAEMEATLKKLYP
ncbi:hypothetical protein [Dyadobacter sp. NIV53]|uniref:hypothetical protein n=1 Tax=Dyadobacter sp. NIV53 TaxID=2861765 RepID=UPI001C87CC1E|nr:hypothetical protein [Dyadobacter sp. NIV53]